MSLVYVVMSTQTFDKRTNVALAGVFSDENRARSAQDALVTKLWGDDEGSFFDKKERQRGALIIPFELGLPTLRFFKAEDAALREVFGLLK